MFTMLLWACRHAGKQAEVLNQVREGAVSRASVGAHWRSAGVQANGQGVKE